MNTKNEKQEVPTKSTKRCLLQRFSCLLRFLFYPVFTFQAVKKIGFLNLFTRSLPIRIMLVGPVVTLQWLFYDSIKILSGL